MDLKLPLKEKWFNMTKENIKKEDYREINIYWATRLIYNLKDCLLFRLNQCFIDDNDCYQFLTNPRNNFGFKDFDKNIMTLGYPKADNSDRILKFKHEGIEIRTGNPNWGAEPNKYYFVIKHGNLIK